jgi:KaiC/GvpD/RAD55 family RecA-like ATPase
MRGRDLERATAEAPGRQAEKNVWGPRGRGYFGVDGLDDLLPVGLSYDTQVMAIGETGVGKTVLAAQFIYEGLLVGDNCVFIACDEPPNVMRLNMANFRLGSLAYERSRRLVFVDAYARERSTEAASIPEPNNLDEFFAYERDVIERFGDRPVRLVVDSLSTVFGTADRSAIVEFNRNRLRYLRSRRVLTLDNYVTGLLDEQTVAGLSHAYPLIVKLGFLQADGNLQRFLQLGKLRSGQFSGERLTYRVDPRVGIVVQG